MATVPPLALIAGQEGARGARGLRGPGQMPPWNSAEGPGVQLQVNVAGFRLLLLQAADPAALPEALSSWGS